MLFKETFFLNGLVGFQYFLVMFLFFSFDRVSILVMFLSCLETVVYERAFDRFPSFSRFSFLKYDYV